MEPNIHKFQAFVSTAKLGSFTGAAAELGYTQPSVSRMVSGLEDEWGVRLFVRHGSYVSLTPEGKAILPAAEETCIAYERLNDCVSNLRGLEVGSLRIAAPTSVVARCLPGPLGRFVSDHPKIKIHIVECTYGEAARLVSADEADLAFIPEKIDREGFTSTLYLSDEFVVVAPRGHFPSKPERVAIQSLVNERFVADSETAPLLQRELTNTVQHFDTSDFTAILSMVEKGLGVSLLPSLALEGNKYDLDVRRLEQPARRNIYLVRRNDHDLSLVASTFIGYLENEKPVQSVLA